MLFWALLAYGQNEEDTGASEQWGRGSHVGHGGVTGLGLSSDAVPSPDASRVCYLTGVPWTLWSSFFDGSEGGEVEPMVEGSEARGAWTAARPGGPGRQRGPGGLDGSEAGSQCGVALSDDAFVVLVSSIDEGGESQLLLREVESVETSSSSEGIGESVGSGGMHGAWGVPGVNARTRLRTGGEGVVHRLNIE